MVRPSSLSGACIAPGKSVSDRSTAGRARGGPGSRLIVQWPDEVRPVLGVSETYKTKEGFVEVIYPAMDGYIYFYDLESGARTRDRSTWAWS